MIGFKLCVSKCVQLLILWNVCDCVSTKLKTRSEIKTALELVSAIKTADLSTIHNTMSKKNLAINEASLEVRKIGNGKNGFKDVQRPRIVPLLISMACSKCRQADDCPCLKKLGCLNDCKRSPNVKVI